jgi:hypothetical protein
MKHSIQEGRKRQQGKRNGVQANGSVSSEHKALSHDMAAALPKWYSFNVADD